MNAKILSCLGAATLLAASLQGAIAELNVADGTIETPDGSFFAQNFTIADDFKLELLYVVPSEEGSWVPLTWDDKGRLIVSSHNSQDVMRLTIPAVGSNAALDVERIDGLNIGSAHGVLYAFDSLYINVDEGNARRNGIYRVTDSNGDDTYDSIEVIRNLSGGGQHGVHTLKLAPDGQSIFVINGDDTPLTVVQSSRVPFNWGEDDLVKVIPTNFNDYQLAPQGWIAHFDPAGRNFELWSIGMRNPVDQAFNKDGELFEYDADMEFDWGTPWYRPTHVGHAVSGADFGYRLRASKRPRYYIDSLPEVANLGAGSPVGTTFGTGAKFPARWQDAMFVLDWSYGNLFAVMVNPTGATYTGEAVPFISGSPFNVTGAIVNPADGSLIVQTGGNGSSQLYRVTYTGNESTAPTRPDTLYANARQLRKNLERFHGRQDPNSIDEIWSYLDSPDRFIRYAARIALEWQDQSLWRERALNETDPRKTIAAMVALARVNGKDEYHRPPDYPAPDKVLQSRMIAALDRIDLIELPFADKLDILRAYSLAFIRLGPPDEATRQRLIARFDPLLPATQRELNWELAEMLVYLDADSAPPKLMALLQNAPSPAFYPIREYLNPILRQRGNPGLLGPAGVSNATLMKQEDEVQYAELLRVAHNGWTPELRQAYFEWFPVAASSYRGGSAFVAGLTAIRADAISQLPEAAKLALGEALETPLVGIGRGGGGGGGAPGGRGGAAPQ